MTTEARKRLPIEKGIVVAGLIAVVWFVWLRPTPEPVLPTDSQSLDPALRTILDTQIAAVRSSPRDATSHGMLGFAYETNAMWQEAEPCYRTAHRLDADDRRWIYHLALAEHATGQVDAAIERLAWLTERDPTYAAAQSRFGSWMMDRGDLELAERAFELVREHAPAAPHGPMGLGRVRVERRQYDEAVALLEEAVRLAPDLEAAHYLLGRAYQGAGRDEDAAPALERGRGAPERHLSDSLDANASKFRAGLGELFRETARLTSLGRPNEAVEILEKARESRPRDPELLVNLGSAYVDTGRFDEAAETLERAKSLGAPTANLEIALAGCRIGQRRFEEALGHANAAVAAAPNIAQAHLALGRSLIALGRLNEAKQSLQRAIELQPNNAKAQLSLGEAHLVSGDYREARERFEKLRELVPGHAPTVINLCELSIRLGDPERARTYLDELRSLAPGQPQVAGLAQRLEALEAGR